ncbi:hypothetical protein AB0C90_00790 [Streptomyces sp. NPDC048550]|uniref:hypothetical protein n=1 Tax=Streptomyces sp. NPDC048550 TaxID=3155739 RepID=UPI00342C13BB
MTVDATGPRRRRRRIGTWPAVGVTVVVLVAANLAVHRWPGLREGLRASRSAKARHT